METQSSVLLSVNNIAKIIGNGKSTEHNKTLIHNDLIFISKALEINTNEAFIIAIIIIIENNRDNGRKSFIIDFLSILGKSKLDIIEYSPFFNSLLDKGYIYTINRCEKLDVFLYNDDDFFITPIVYDAISLNKPIFPHLTTKYDYFIGFLNSFQIIDGNKTSIEMSLKWGKLIETNQHFKIVKKLNDVSINYTYQYIYYSIIYKYIINSTEININKIITLNKQPHMALWKFNGNFTSTITNPLLEYDLIRIIKTTHDNEILITLTNKSILFLQRENMGLCSSALNYCNKQ